MSNEQVHVKFEPTGIKIDYTHVNLLKRQVTATISYCDEVHMTLVTDLTLNQIQKVGSFEKLFSVLPIRDEQSYVEEVNAWAKIFIDKKITNPKGYFESLI